MSMYISAQLSPHVSTVLLETRDTTVSTFLRQSADRNPFTSGAGEQSVFIIQCSHTNNRSATLLSSARLMRLTWWGWSASGDCDYSRCGWLQGGKISKPGIAASPPAHTHKHTHMYNLYTGKRGTRSRQHQTINARKSQESNWTENIL